MNYVVIYADERFYKQKLRFKRWIERQKKEGLVFLAYGPSDIDEDFYRRNKVALDNPKGGGLWLWKPYFISQTLMRMSENDLLFYFDAGSIPLVDVTEFVLLFDQYEDPVISFSLPFKEIYWTKADVFERLAENRSGGADDNQVMASFIFIKKCYESSKFIDTWLYFCVQNNSELLFDSSAPQIDGFVEHRHDQSIFSVLYKRFGFVPVRDISQFGFFKDLYLGRRPRFSKVIRLMVHYLTYLLFARDVLNDTKNCKILHSRGIHPFRYFLHLLIRSCKFWKA